MHRVKMFWLSMQLDFKYTSYFSLLLRLDIFVGTKIFELCITPSFKKHSAFNQSWQMSLQVHTISSNTSCCHLEKLPQKEKRQSVFGGFQQWKDWFSIIWIIAIDIHIVKKAKTNDKCDGNDGVVIRMFVQLYFTILSLLNSCHQFLYLFILLGLVVVSWKPSLKPKWVRKKSLI